MRKLTIRVLWSTLAVVLFNYPVIAQMHNKDAPAKSHSEKLQTAYFAAGCFWKTQYIFSKVPGVVETRVGYTGGTVPNPNYKLVCTDRTGHAETVKVLFDADKVSYHRLLEVFFNNHNPTTANRQGPDVGTQYRSVIFYTSPEQQKEATEYKAELEKLHKFGAPIVTEIVAAKPFYDAEEYHQDYFLKHGAVCY